MRSFIALLVQRVRLWRQLRSVSDGRRCATIPYSWKLIIAPSCLTN
jgi:hypothetical protein